MALNAVCIQVYLEMFERHVHMTWILIIKLLENQNIYDFKKCKKNIYLPSCTSDQPPTLHTSFQSQAVLQVKQL